MPLTLLSMMNPGPRGWGAKKNKTRKPVRATSAKPRKKRRAKQEVGVAKKRRKRRGAGGRFAKSTTRRRGRRKKSSSGSRRRRGRRSSGTVRSKARRGRRRRRRNPGSPLDALSSAFGAATRGRRRRKKSGKKTSSRRRRGKRRTRAVYVRRRRGTKRGKLRNLRRRVYTRSRKGKYRRANPGRTSIRGGIMGNVRRILNIGTVQTAAGVGLGILANQAGPALLRRFAPSLARHASGAWGEAAVGLGANVLLGTILGALGYGNLGFKTIIGGVVATGGRGLKIAMGSYRRSSAPVLTPVPGQAGMGSIVSPEAMIESQALLSGMGDFVQLSGGIPRRDFRGMGDYIEFKSQAAGAQAMASQLATSEVFSPGADEKF